MVTPFYYPRIGGAELLVHDMSAELNKKGIFTSILTYNMNDKGEPLWRANIEINEGIMIFRIPALKVKPYLIHQVTQKINMIPGKFLDKMKEYDIIHFHDVNDLSLPTFSILSNKPKILHSHGFSDFYIRYPLSRFIFKNVSDYYISPSKKFINEILLRIGIPESRVLYLPNFVNTEEFRPSSNKINNMILFVGRIEYAKGLHILLECLQYLTSSTILMIIGPSSGDSIYFDHIMNLIQKVNERKKHKVTYLGPLRHKDLIKWYQRASIFVLPTFTEVFGLVNAEALSCGTPVITTDVGGIPEIIQTYKNGILIPPNNSPRLAQAIQYLLDNDDIRNKLGNEGRETVLKHFSTYTVINKLCNIYKQIFDKEKAAYD